MPNCTSEPPPAPRARPAPSLGDENLAGLLTHYAHTRDARSRETLILHHQKLVRYIAARFLDSGEHMDDLVQVGTVGLILAIDRFDPAQDVKFSTYAMPTIVGEIKRHFRDKTWHVKVPRWLQELSLSARRTQQTLTMRLGRPPLISEIAAALGASEDETLQALEVAEVAAALSLDTRLDANAGSESATLMDVIGRIDAALHDFEAYTDLRRALGRLEAREQEVIHLRFFEELSQSKIARKLGLSQMQISRLQKRALQKLHAV
ncbi:MAG: SigB/SigF/SigG family RNA polymerase sigma factor, partial [Armatimonadota bacterium]|nr:SigB/SigF/SigG family RNA polymerase sigma factor [Armatimonadota bacterium]